MCSFFLCGERARAVVCVCVCVCVWIGEWVRLMHACLSVKAGMGVGVGGWGEEGQHLLIGTLSALRMSGLEFNCIPESGGPLVGLSNRDA